MKFYIDIVRKIPAFLYLKLKALKKQNLIIGSIPIFENSKIQFKGCNNILYCEDGVKIRNSNIVFKGDNSLIFLKKGKYNLDVDIYNNSTLYIGENNYFHPHLINTKIILSEEKNVFIGNDNIISLNCFIRTADPHLIYDTNTKERLNYSKSVYIGDHIWLGQGTTILKGTQIHSGAIVGAKSLVSNKVISSNTVWGGNPAKLIKKDIFWEPKSVHSWQKTDTEQYRYYENDDFIYTKEETSVDFNLIEQNLSNLSHPAGKIEYLKNLSDKKNRFSLS